MQVLKHGGEVCTVQDLSSDWWVGWGRQVKCESQFLEGDTKMRRPLALPALKRMFYKQNNIHSEESSVIVPLEG